MASQTIQIVRRNRRGMYPKYRNEHTRVIGVKLSFKPSGEKIWQQFNNL